MRQNCTLDFEIIVLKLEIAPYCFHFTSYLNKCLLVNRSLSKFHCSILLKQCNPYTNNPKLATLVLKLSMNRLENICLPKSCLFCSTIFPSLLKVWIIHLFGEPKQFMVNYLVCLSQKVAIMRFQYDILIKIWVEYIVHVYMLVHLVLVCVNFRFWSISYFIFCFFPRATCKFLGTRFRECILEWSRIDIIFMQFFRVSVSTG